MKYKYSRKQIVNMWSAPGAYESGWRTDLLATKETPREKEIEKLDLYDEPDETYIPTNWQLTEKVNEVIQRVNDLTKHDH